jgi:hypothetical protein
VPLAAHFPEPYCRTRVRVRAEAFIPECLHLGPRSCELPVRVIEPFDFLPEEQVLQRWPMLTRTELRRARKASPPRISFYAFPKKSGGPCYTPEQVQAYIDATYLRAGQCDQSRNLPSSQALSNPPSGSRSADTTSAVNTSIVAAPGTPAAMTPELAASAAEALAQRILSRRKSSSQHSSPRPRNVVERACRTRTSS